MNIVENSEVWESNTFPAWDFRNQNVLIGEVANFGYIKLGDRDVERVIIIERGTGKKLSLLLTATLKTAFSNLNIDLGDIVRITYNGEKKSPTTKRTYHDFTVEKKVK